MNRSKLKAICTIGILMLVVFGDLTACGSQNTSNKSVSKLSGDARKDEIAKGKVNLNMYLVGDPQVDQEKVYSEINKMMEKDINTTVTINNVPWADFLKKYQLLFASGESFDCAFSGNFCNYSDLATKNAFMEIKPEMIKTYAPTTYEDLDPYYVKGSKINGKMYMVPANQHDVRGSLVAIRGDLREKYNLPVIKTVDDYYNYLETIAKNEKISAYSSDTGDTSWFDSLFGRYYGITNINILGNNVNSFDEKPKVYNALESKQFLDFAKKMKELSNAGVFPKNMLSSKIKGDTLFTAGTVASCLQEPTGLYQAASKSQKAHPEWKVEVYDLSNPSTPLAGLSPSDAGLVINPKSEHPERVLMMLDLLRENKKYQDLTFLGIEGTHWKAVGDLGFTELTNSKAFQFNSNCPWAWTNDKYKRNDADTPQSLLDIKKKWNGMAKNAPINAFSFDDTNVKNEEAAINNVLSKYKNLLLYGFEDNPEKTIEQMNNELKSVGLDKVQKETQTKLDKFISDYNNK